MIALPARTGFTLIEVLSALLIGSLVMGMAGQFLHSARSQLVTVQSTLTVQESARTLVLQVRAGLMQPGRWHCAGRPALSGWDAGFDGGWRPGPGLDALGERMPLPRPGTDVLLVDAQESGAACAAGNAPDPTRVAYYIADNAGGDPALFRRELYPERSPRVELSPGVYQLTFRLGIRAATGGLRWYSTADLPFGATPQLLEMRFAVAGPRGDTRRFRVTLPTDGVGWSGGAV